MVRLNQKAEFHFPFVSTNSATQSSSSNLNIADRILSSFAGVFFFSILLLISLDFSNGKNISNSSELFASSNSSNLLPLAVIEKENLKIISSKEETKLKIKNETVQPKKRKIAVLTPEFKKEISLKSPIEKRANQEVIISKKEIKPQQNIHLNQPKIPTEVKNLITKPVPRKDNFQAKPVLVDSKWNHPELVINDKITQDLLPTSYFEAMEKAAIEGKSLYIKFGAKWCLPCKQMEKTTFKDEKVKEYSDANYVSLSIDVDDFDGLNLKSYYNVKFLPTLLIFNSHGNFVAKYVNYQSAKSFLHILEKHNSKSQKIVEEESVEPKEKTLAKLPSINFNQIKLSKKKNGSAITSLKSKAKNWRFTQLNFTTKNITEGELLIKVKETQTGSALTELYIPVLDKNKRISDTTTTNFQLILEHQKRKKKDGNYVLEIYSVSNQTSKLIGKTTLLKDGEILF